MQHSDYRSVIGDTYAGELTGQRFAERLCETLPLDERQHGLVCALGALEGRMAELLAPIAKRLGIAAPTYQIVDDQARAMAGQIKDWKTLIDLLLDAAPPFCQILDALARNAAPGDEDALALVAWHEHALVQFARSEAVGNDTPLAVLDWTCADPVPYRKQSV